MPKGEDTAPVDTTDKANNSAPESTDMGTTEIKNSEAPSDLPEKFQGKSPAEIAQSYLELERKMGEQSKTVEKAKELEKQLQDWGIVADVLRNNPELYKQVDNALSAKMRGESNLPETRTDSPFRNGDEEAGKETDPKLVDTRRAIERQIISDFEKQRGLDKLPQDKRNDLFKRISSELVDLLDPAGNKSIQQVLSEVSLERLPKVLDKAYWLANKEALVDRGNSDQDLASIGRLSSSSVEPNESVSLSKQELEIAQKLGVKPEKFLENKRELQNSK